MEHNISRIAIIGSSVFGHKTVPLLLKDLHVPPSSCVVCIPHVRVPEIYDELSDYGHQVKYIVDGDVLQPQSIYIGRGDDPKQLEHGWGIGRKLNIKDLGNEYRFEFGDRLKGEVYIDYAFESVAEMFGPKALGIILTGMGSDGAKGLKKIKEKGGKTLVEKVAFFDTNNMPSNALATGMVDEELYISKLRERLQNYLEGN